MPFGDPSGKQEGSTVLLSSGVEDKFRIDRTRDGLNACAMLRPFVTPKVVIVVHPIRPVLGKVVRFQVAGEGKIEPLA